MTTLGRFTVLLVFLFSFALLAWTIVLFTQRPEWVDRKTKDGTQIKGVLTEVETQVGSTRRPGLLAEASRQGLTRFAEADKDLASSEATRLARQDWHRKALTMMETGAIDGRAVSTPMIDLVDERSTPPGPLYQQSELDPSRNRSLADRVIKFGDQPLQTFNTYARRIAQSFADQADLNRQLGSETDDFRSQTDSIRGRRDAMGALTQKGLDLRIQDINDLKRSAVEEAADLTDEPIKLDIKLAQLRRRTASLEARLNELSPGGAGR